MANSPTPRRGAIDGAVDILPRSIIADNVGLLPAAAVQTGVAQDIAAGGTWYDVVFGVTEWQQAGCVASPAGIAVPADGLYLVTGQLEWNVTTGIFSYQAGITVNTSANQIWGAGRDSFDVGYGSQPFARPVRVRRGDVIGLAAWSSNAPGNQSLVNHFCALEVVWASATPANVLPGNVQ